MSSVGCARTPARAPASRNEQHYFRAFGAGQQE